MMRFLPYCFLISLFLLSCRKDETEGYSISHFPENFHTVIEVTHDPTSSENLPMNTLVYVRFYQSTSGYYQGIILGPNSSLSYDNIPLETYSYGDLINIPGLVSADLEFNYEGEIYTNSIPPPDSTYFTSHQDTIQAGNNAIVGYEGNALKTGEYLILHLNYFSDDTMYKLLLNSDGTITIPYNDLIPGAENHLILSREFNTSDLNLPSLGGDLLVRYKTYLTFYVEE